MDGMAAGIEAGKVWVLCYRRHGNQGSRVVPRGHMCDSEGCWAVAGEGARAEGTLHCLWSKQCGAGAQGPLDAGGRQTQRPPETAPRTTERPVEDVGRTAEEGAEETVTSPAHPEDAEA